jgi:hypothetical protein
MRKGPGRVYDNKWNMKKVGNSVWNFIIYCKSWFDVFFVSLQAQTCDNSLLAESKLLWRFPIPPMYVGVFFCCLVYSGDLCYISPSTVYSVYTVFYKHTSSSCEDPALYKCLTLISVKVHLLCWASRSMRKVVEY